MVEHSLWRKVIKHLQPKIKKADLLVWFQSTAILSHEGSKIVIGVPSIFAQEWFNKRYKDMLFEAFSELSVDVDEIDIEIESSLIEEASEGIDMREFLKGSDKKVRKVRNRQEVKVTAPSEQFGSSQFTSRLLNPKYTLDSFVVGADNRLAHAAASAVARKPGVAYNPLFVYGDVGLGKTHLLQGIGNGILDFYPDMLVVYGSAEKFTNEIVDAIKKNQVKAFRDRYRRADCLIIDDIQFLAKKSRTQEEFFSYF